MSQQLPPERFSNHWEYVAIAWANLETARHAQEMEAKLDGSHPHFGSVGLYYDHQVRCCPIVAVIFSHLGLEGYINNLAKVKLDDTTFQATDRLEFVAKWSLIPKLAFGKCLDSSLIARLESLRILRNHLVHARPHYFSMPPKQKDNNVRAKYVISIPEAERAYQTCEDAIAAIRDIDPDFEDEAHFLHAVTSRFASPDKLAFVADFEEEVRQAAITPHIIREGGK